MGRVLQSVQYPLTHSPQYDKEKKEESKDEKVRDWTIHNLSLKKEIALKSFRQYHNEIKIQ